MHPLLAQPRSLSAYLLFWAGLSVVPWVLMRSRTPFGALAASAGSTVAFALGTLSVWYLCRALPLLPARLWRVVSIHVAAACLWSIGFLACTRLLAELLALLPAWRALPADVRAAETALLGVGALFYLLVATFNYMLAAACLWSIGFLVCTRLLAELLALLPAWRALPTDVRATEAALLGVGALFYLLVATFNYMLAELEQRRTAGEREAVLALAAQRAELAALRAQVHPHFLFNSLNTVSALIGYDTGKAREACLLLAEYLRGTLRAQERPLVTLREEWALCERYLAVEALRLGARLRVEVLVETSAEACEIPSLLLQPLVENAVTHGIAPLDEPLPLRVRARLRDARLRVEVENGVDPTPRRREGGLGLANVRARLFGQYGDEATLRIERDLDRFTVVIDLPASSLSRAEAG